MVGVQECHCGGWGGAGGGGRAEVCGMRRVGDGVIKGREW